MNYFPLWSTGMEVPTLSLFKFLHFIILRQFELITSLSKIFWSLSIVFWSIGFLQKPLTYSVFFLRISLSLPFYSFFSYFEKNLSYYLSKFIRRFKLWCLVDNSLSLIVYDKFFTIFSFLYSLLPTKLWIPNDGRLSMIDIAFLVEMFFGKKCDASIITKYNYFSHFRSKRIIKYLRTWNCER